MVQVMVMPNGTKPLLETMMTSGQLQPISEIKYNYLSQHICDFFSFGLYLQKG